jgi:hypothetical protein
MPREVNEKLRRANYLDLAGQTFGRLTILERCLDDRYLDNRVRWHCLCTCGNRTVTTTDKLRSGMTKSCGCLHGELAGERLKIYRQNPRKKTA